MQQEEPFRLVRQVLGPLPILDRFIERIGLPEHLTEATRRATYARALLLLLKNIVLERNALYAIREWAAPYDPALVYGGNYSDDVLARALDFLSTSARSPSRDFLFVNTYPAFSRAAVIAVSLTSGQTMEAWFCRMFALCQVCSTPLGNQPLLAAPDRCPPTSLGCPSIFGRGIALASLASDSSSS